MNGTRGNEHSPGPDGGRPGWIAVLTLWTKNVVWVGILKGLGIMLPTVQDQLATETWIIGWITAMVVVVNGCTGPFAGLLSRRFKTGYVIMTCGTMIGVAAIGASFSETDLQLALVYALLAGMGLGVSNVVCKEAVGRRFTSNYATANGIARTGYSIGLFVWAPLVQLFLNTYGWRGTILLVGGISLHLVVCGALMVTIGATATDYQRVFQDESPTTLQKNIPACCSTLWGYISEKFDLKLLGNVNYWSVAAISCCTAFAFTMWIVYFVSQAQSNGFSLDEAGTMVTIAGVASLLGKGFQGPITDRGVISSWSLTAIFVTINSVSFCATPWLTSYWIMVTSACLIPFGEGVLSCQTDVLMKETLGVDLLAGAFGWMGMTASVLIFALGFLPGWIYDNTGSYTTAFLVIGGVQALPLISLLVLRHRKQAGHGNKVPK